jgi:hypothetical protein
VVAWLTAEPAPRPLVLRWIYARLTARLWKRRLSLLGLLLLALGVLCLAYGRVARYGWVGRSVIAVVWLEMVLLGAGLLRLDVGELRRRVLRRHAVARQSAQERREAAAHEGPPQG